MKQGRIEYIDTAKGLCIVLLVLYHVGNNCHIEGRWWTALSTFQIPLFFILSGMFYKASSDFILKKINGLLVPFSFWYITSAILLPFLVVNIAHIESDLFFYRMSWPNCMRFYTEELYFNNPIWFLLCLFELNVLFFSLERALRKTSLLTIASLALGGLGFMFGAQGVNLTLYLDTALTSMPFFCLGYLIYSKTDILRTDRYDKYLPYLIVVGAIFVYYAVCPVVYFRNRFEPNSMFNVYSCGIVGSAVVIMIAKMAKSIPLVTYWGRYSIVVLVTHAYIQPIFEKIIEHAGISSSIIAALLVTLGVMLTMLLIIPVLTRLLPHATAQKQLFRLR